MPETSWRQKTPFILLLPLLESLIKKKKKYCAVAWAKSYYLLFLILKILLLLLFKVVKMTLLKPTILCDLHIEPAQTPLERSLQATMAPYTIIINTT